MPSRRHKLNALYKGLGLAVEMAADGRKSNRMARRKGVEKRLSQMLAGVPRHNTDRGNLSTNSPSSTPGYKDGSLLESALAYPSTLVPESARSWLDENLQSALAYPSTLVPESARSWLNENLPEGVKDPLSMEGVKDPLSMLDKPRQFMEEHLGRHTPGPGLSGLIEEALTNPDTGSPYRKGIGDTTIVSAPTRPPSGERDAFVDLKDPNTVYAGPKAAPVTLAHEYGHVAQGLEGATPIDAVIQNYGALLSGQDTHDPATGVPFEREAVDEGIEYIARMADRGDEEAVEMLQRISKLIEQREKFRSKKGDDEPGYQEGSLWNQLRQGKLFDAMVGESPQEIAQQVSAGESPFTGAHMSARPDLATHALASQKMAERWGVPAARLMGVANEVGGGLIGLGTGQGFFGEVGFDLSDLNANEVGFEAAESTPWTRFKDWISKPRNTAGEIEKPRGWTGVRG